MEHAVFRGDVISQEGNGSFLQPDSEMEVAHEVGGQGEYC